MSVHTNQMSYGNEVSRKNEESFVSTKTGLALLHFSSVLQLLGGIVYFLLLIAIAYNVLAMPGRIQNGFSIGKTMGPMLIVLALIWLGAIVLGIVGIYYCLAESAKVFGKFWVNFTLGSLWLSALFVQACFASFSFDPTYFQMFLKARILSVTLAEICLMIYAKKLVQHLRGTDELNSVMQTFAAFAFCFAIVFSQLNFLAAVLVGGEFPKSIANSLLALECIYIIVWLISTILFMSTLGQIRKLLKNQTPV